MTFAVKFIPIGFAALTLGDILLACAHESEDGETPSEAEPPRSSGDASANDVAPPERDAGSDADGCAASKICVHAVPIDEDTNLASVWGSSASDVWAVGSSGTVLHYDGEVWEKADRPDVDASTSFTLRSVWLERPDEVWISDGNRIRRGTGWNGPSATEWSFFSYPTSQRIPTAIRGKDGRIWLARGLTSGSGQPLATFTGWVNDAPNAVLNITAVNLPIKSIVLSRPDELWAISSQDNRVFRVSAPVRDGGPADASPSTWLVETHDSNTNTPAPGGRFGLLFGVWGDESAIWLVGERGTIRRMTRESVPKRVFQIVPSPIVADLYDIFGFGPDDVWVVGESSTVLHWDGTSWTRLSTPFDDKSDKPRLFGVWGSSPKDVWIAGEGTMLHFSETP